MADLQKAHEVEGGIILDGAAGVFAADFDPIVTGFAAEKGSLILRDTGQIYRKIGSDAMAWDEMDVIPVQVGLGEWTFEAGITAPPTDKMFKLNNAAIESSTKLFIDYNNFNGDDLTTILQGIGANDLMFFERPNGSFFIRVSANTDQGTYAEIDIAQIEAFGSPNTGQRFSLTISVSGAGGGSTTFLGLTDTPSTFASQALKRVRVNAGETALEFVAQVEEDLDAVQVRRSTTFTITTAFTDVSFDLTDLENSPTVLEHDNIDTDRIQIKETGLYYVWYKVNVNSPGSAGNAEIRGLVRLNDITDLDDSHADTTVFRDSSIPGALHDDTVSNPGFTRQFTAGDFISLRLIKDELGSATTTTTEAGECQMAVFKMSAPAGVDGVDGADGAQGPQGIPGSGSSITVEDEGISVPNTPHTILDFVGAGVTATDATAGRATITIPGGGAITRLFQFFADHLDNPNNADWAVNSLAPADADSNNNGLTVRLFDDTIEGGVGFELKVPAGVTNIVLDFVARAETAPPAVRTVGLKLYNRGIPDNAAVEVWSAGLALTDIDIPTNEFFQYDSQTITLASLGITADEVTQFELTRVAPGAGVNLVGNWALKLLQVRFT